MQEHFVKCWPEYFQAAWDGIKPFENRKDDRRYAVGDRVTMEEWNPTSGQFTGRWLRGIITYKTDFGTVPGFVSFAWREEARGAPPALTFEEVSP